MKTVKIGSIAKIFNGYAFKSTEYSDDGFQVIRITNVQNGYISNANKKFIKLTNKALERFILEEGDILISLTGNVGRTGRIEKENLPAVLNQRVGKVIIKSKEIFPAYLFHVLSSNIVESELMEKAKGIAQKNIGSSDIENVEISLPSLEDQKRVVKILDEANTLRQKRKQALILLDDYLKSVFWDMFGDPMSNPKEWKIEKLKNITSKIGSGATPKGGKAAYLSAGISLIRSLNIHDNKFLYKNLAFINDQQAKALSSVSVEEHDVLLNITGASVCRCAIVPADVLPARVNQHVSILRLNNSMQPVFLLSLLISKNYKRKLLKDATSGGATREALTKQQLEKLEIICPPLELQNKFLIIVRNCEKIKQQMLVQSKELETQFQALMQKAFKGEL